MNQKWYINELGIKVKPCKICGKDLPYTKEFFSTRGKGKWQAYCKGCSNKKSRKYNKTNQTRKFNPTFIENEVEYKQCTRCNTVYPNTFEFFDKSQLGQKGLRADCRRCRLDYGQHYAEKKWAWNLYNNARASTNRYGLEDINIDEQYVLDLFEKQNHKCYWLGVDLVPSSEKKHPFQPSLDRLDRNRGYIKGNVVLCCFVANFGRNENTEESWKQFLKKLQMQLNYNQWNE